MMSNLLLVQLMAASFLQWHFELVISNLVVWACWHSYVYLIVATLLIHCLGFLGVLNNVSVSFTVRFRIREVLNCL